MDFVEIFNISLDLSSIYFAHFSGCWASFVYSCHSILKCYNLFSGAKLSIRSFSFISSFYHQTTNLGVILTSEFLHDFCTWPLYIIIKSELRYHFQTWILHFIRITLDLSVIFPSSALRFVSNKWISTSLPQLNSSLFTKKRQTSWWVKYLNSLHYNQK